jgi:hypothetical protein
MWLTAPIPTFPARQLAGAGRGNMVSGPHSTHKVALQPAAPLSMPGVMESLLSFLATDEAVATLVVVVAAILFLIVWRLYGPD